MLKNVSWDGGAIGAYLSHDGGELATLLVGDRVLNEKIWGGWL